MNFISSSGNNLISAEEREDFINSNVHLVKIIAHQVAVHLPPHIEIEDLISAGTIGLLEALERFDKSKGVQFKTFASIRIRGAIMDELRTMDWMTRSMREKSNMLERAYSEVENLTGRPAETEEVAEHLDISTDELHDLLRQVSALSLFSLEDMGVRGDDEALDILEAIEDPEGKDPMVLARISELKAETIKAVEGLKEKERLVISLYYYDELTLKEIGKVLDITESRVCQIHSETMLKLKGRLKRIV